MSDKVTIGIQEFDALIAITAEEQCNGLMYRSWPPPVMAFPYRSAEVRKFWMKNTISPLDIVFCRQGRIISICKGEPFSLDNVGPDEPADLIVEFPQGTMKRNNISVGARIKLSYSAQTLSKKFKNYLLID